MERGKFVTFEGGEGTGKSTQIARLAGALLNEEISVITTREPGGSPGAETIRQLLLNPQLDWDTPTETLLHFAARSDHYTTKIAPALKNGSWVLCDRFADSTRVYQGYGLGVSNLAIEMLYDLILGDFKPDLTLVLDLPLETSLERMQTRGEAPDRYEKMDFSFHKRLREGFLEIAYKEPGRCVVIDASGTIETVTSRIMASVRERLGTKFSI
tara:strand:+ start:6009 stop:6647 length:639 start_codon:yes stop_codon:yes gene_type:complete